MAALWKRAYGFIRKDLWLMDVFSMSGSGALAVKSMRLLYATVREFTEGQLTMRAMSLVYTTLLSLVPLIAVSFSVLKGFGVHNQIEPLLGNFLAPLGPKGQEITHKILEFVSNIKVGLLGSLGLAMLVYTVISLFRKVEGAFNYIWRIKHPRGFARRFSDYISVLLIGPVLIFSALGLTASVTSTAVVQKLIEFELFGTAFYVAGKLMPYVFVCAAFTFIYIFMPGRKVNFISAMVGGVFAGVLWETSGWAFASFIVSSSKYTAIYSGFAILIFFMFWLYLSWLILLIGARMSFYHQHPQFLSLRKETLRMNNRLKERLALVVMLLIGENHYRDLGPWSLNALSDRLGFPGRALEDVLDLLIEARLVVELGEEPPSYLPAKDIGTITLREVLDSVRSSGTDSKTLEEKLCTILQVDGVIGSVEEGITASLDGRTVKDLVLAKVNHE